MTRREWIDDLFKKHSEALFFYLRLFRLPEDETYDLVQAVFLKLIELKPGNLKQPKAWLFAVGRNMALNALSRNKRFKSASDAPEPVGNNPNALSLLLDDEEHALLWRAFSRLPEEDREMYRLHLEQGFTYRQIAEVLGKSEGAVRVAMHRSRNRLREFLKRRSVNESPGGSRR